MHLNKKGFILFISLSVVLIIAIISAGYFHFVGSQLVQMKKIADSTKAFYIAEAGLQRMAYELAIVKPPQMNITENFAGGSYSVSYDISDSTIESTGTIGSMSRKVVQGVNIKSIPTGVKAAVTVYSSVVTTGNITIDGRDYDEDANLTGESGTFGITTTGSYTESGSSDVGGNGIAPSNPAQEDTFQENYTLEPDEGTDPWDALGVTQSWFNANIATLKTSTVPSPGFSGIVYYEPPSGEWNPVEFGVNTPSSGILIVHNAAGTATMKNLHGIFSGLIIADNVIHINGEALILGAIVAKNSSSTLGMGNAEVLYSSSVLSGLSSLKSGISDNWTKTYTLKPSTWREYE